MGNAVALFVISESTGVITKQEAIDREVQSEYQFTVIVRDTPLFDTENTDTAQIKITVRDVNEFPPLADPSIYYTLIPESTAVNSPLETFVTVRWSTTRKPLGLIT